VARRSRKVKVRAHSWTVLSTSIDHAFTSNFVPQDQEALCCPTPFDMT
jgi:hypothetical protein